MNREFWENFLDEQEEKKGWKEWTLDMASLYAQAFLWGAFLIAMIFLFAFVGGAI